MKKLLLVLPIILALGCPKPGEPANPLSPYTTARTIIMSSQIALNMADGVFETWAMTQDDADKVAGIRAKYILIRTAVSNGLKVALDGVAIAEQAKTDPDITKLMAQAETAWQDLRKMLTDMWPLIKPRSTSQPAGPTFTPTDLPPTLLAKQ